MTNCQPGANRWIAEWLGDCIYNERDLVGFLMGLGSIMCWLVAQVPQLVANYRNKSADALSPFFLAEWLLGDTCNLVGALLQGDQLPTVVYTAEYFVCMDVVLLIQFIYYTTLQRRRERLQSRRHRHHRHRHRQHRQHLPQAAVVPGEHPQQQQQQQWAGGGGSSGGGAPLPEVPAVVVAHTEAAASLAPAGGGNSSNGREFVFRPQRVLACVGLVFLLSGLQPQPPQQQLMGLAQVQEMRHLLVVESASPEVLSKKPSWAQEAGTVIAYCSSVLYLASRISQLTKNWRRRSAEGLALSMFLCAIAANTLYGLSIVVRAHSLASLRSSAPWLAGSLGTVALDITIFMQGMVYGTEKKHASDEEEALLPGEGGKH